MSARKHFLGDARVKRGTCLPCAACGRLINTVSERGEYVVHARGGCWQRYYHPECEPVLPTDDGRTKGNRA